MKNLLTILLVCVGLSVFAQTPTTSPSSDYSGLLKTVTMTNAQTDSTVFTIAGKRSAITIKTDIIKTSGTVAGTVLVQYKLTGLASELWYTYNSYTLTDASAINTISLPNNPALRWKILTNTTGTSISTHRQYLLFRQ